MIVVSQRVRAVREHRRLTRQELAHRAGLSPSTITLLEKRNRFPRGDTVEKIAGVLEVSLDFLWGKEDAAVALPQALARQSLRLFLRDNQVSEEQERFLNRVRGRASAPETVGGWHDLLLNLAIFESMVAK